MSVDVFPQSIQGTGKVRVQFVPTLANPELPTLAELTAGDAFDATCYFRADAFVINHEQETKDDTRLCDDSARESLGLSKYTLADDLSYINDPQAAPASPGNLAEDAFVAGTTGYFVVRGGLKSSTAFAAGQMVTVYAVTFGDQHEPIPTGDNAVFVITQPITLSREVRKVALAA